MKSNKKTGIKNLKIYFYTTCTLYYILLVAAAIYTRNECCLCSCSVREKGFKYSQPLIRLCVSSDHNLGPSFWLETRGFPLSWGKEVVEEGKGYYPGGLRRLLLEKKWKTGLSSKGGKHCAEHSVLKRDRGRGEYY
nr:hypothetical protein [Tanacetum cinerariifolium]